MQPIKQTQDLLNAVIVQSRISSPINDYPIPGLSWYYAVVYEEDIISGQIVIRPGVNSTVSSVRLGEDASELSLRSLPLPSVTVYYALPEERAVIPVTPLSDSVLRAIEGMGFYEKAARKREPEIFMIDSMLPSSGEESALVYIVQNSFHDRDWETASAELLRYLSLPLSREVEGRARFYFAQTCYFLGQYREALFELFAIQSIYPSEARSWINATLSAMAR